MSSFVRDYETVTKSAGDVSGPREATKVHNRCFGDMVEKASEASALPGDQLTYWDPMGFLGRDPVDLKTPMFKKWEPAFQEFNRHVREGADIEIAAEQAVKNNVSKSLQRSNYSLPTFQTPDVFIQDEQDLPLADMLPRTAVQEDTVEVDELTDTGAASQFDETAANWPNNDDTYSNLSYDIKSYGRENDVTDFVQLAAGSLRSTRALTEEQQVRAIRQYEEAQIIQGQGTDANVAGNDASGFVGLSDTGNTTDQAGGAISLSLVRDQIRKLRRNGADRSDIVHATDHKTFQDLQSDLDDFTRYESPSDTLSFGFNALEIDNTMVMETHGSPNSSNSRLFTSFDASANYMAMLQDVTMHPLAKNSPQESFATDAYGALVSESANRIEVLTSLA